MDHNQNGRCPFNTIIYQEIIQDVGGQTDGQETGRCQDHIGLATGSHFNNPLLAHASNQ